MNDTQFTTCVRECAAYTSRESYISDMATSSVWGDSTDAAVPQARMDAIGAIWDAVNRTMREIVSAAGMTQAAFAEHFCIPRRTVEDWCRGVRECPLYTRLLMQQCLGLFVPPVK